MAENTRPPVAIRIVRPYDNEDDLLESELETFGKTTVILVGAHPRPTGVILRFEMTLASGAPVLRGEGRVLAHKENAFRNQSGLLLRFTRLDPKSKAFVDRASAVRDARAPISTRPQAPDAAVLPSRPPARVDSPIAEALTASTPPPGPSMSATEQEIAVANARAAARERANALARSNARRTGWPSSMPEARHAEDETAPASSPVPPIPSSAPESKPFESVTAVKQEAIDERPVPSDAVETVTAIEREVADEQTSSSDIAEVDEDEAGRHGQASSLANEGPDFKPDRTDRGHHLRALDPIAPEERNALLSRLRTRASALSVDRIAEILSARTRE